MPLHDSFVTVRIRAQQQMTHLVRNHAAQQLAFTEWSVSVWLGQVRVIQLDIRSFALAVGICFAENIFPYGSPSEHNPYGEMRRVTDTAAS